MKISPDEFAAAAKVRDAGKVSIVRAGGAADLANSSGRIIRYLFSTPDVARDNHTIAHWQLDNFQANPVFLWAHESKSPPIGKVVELEDRAGRLSGSVQYAERDEYEFADTIFRLVKGGYIHAVSTSWDPIKWKFTTDRARPGGVDFELVDLLELSQVPVPALPNALATARAAGIDTGPLYQWAEQVLDSGGMLLVPRAELEALRREAKMPSGSWKSRAEAADKARREAYGWKVGASRTIPVDEGMAWPPSDEKPDGMAAKQFAEYQRKSHLISRIDSSSVAVRFAAITSDGKLRTCRAGLDAAAAELSAADLPEGIRAEADEVLAQYYDRYNPNHDKEGKFAAKSGGALKGAAIGAAGGALVGGGAGAIAGAVIGAGIGAAVSGNKKTGGAKKFGGGSISKAVDEIVANGKGGVSTVMDLEEAFGIDLGDDASKEMTNAEITKLVKKKMKEQGRAFRSLSGISQAAYLLQCASYLSKDCAFEAEYEKDGSPLPAELAAITKQLGEWLKKYVSEEIQEELTGGAPVDDLVMRAFSRSGKVLSSASERSLRECHDHMTRGCDMLKRFIDDALGDMDDEDSDGDGYERYNPKAISGMFGKELPENVSKLLEPKILKGRAASSDDVAVAKELLAALSDDQKEQLLEVLRATVARVAGEVEDDEDDDQEGAERAIRARRARALELQLQLN